MLLYLLGIRRGWLKLKNLKLAPLRCGNRRIFGEKILFFVNIGILEVLLSYTSIDFWQRMRYNERGGKIKNVLLASESYAHKSGA